MKAPMHGSAARAEKQIVTAKDIALANHRRPEAADRNPYSWNMSFSEYPDNGYEDLLPGPNLCADEKNWG